MKSISVIKKYYLKSILLSIIITFIIILLTALTNFYHISSIIKIKYISIFFVIVFFIIILIDIRSLIRIQFLQKLFTQDTLDRIIFYGKNECLLTEKYLIVLNEFSIFKQIVPIIKFDDIVFLYKESSYNSNGRYDGLVIITKKNKRYEIPAHTVNLCNKITNDKLSEILIKLNPDILEGNTEENRGILKRKYNIELNTNFYKKCKLSFKTYIKECLMLGILLVLLRFLIFFIATVCS